MKQNIFRFVIPVALLAATSSAEAVKVVDKKLEIYGKVHMSVDYSDRDIDAVTNDGMSISNNSSRLGFKGELPAGDMKLIYQYEQGVNLDSGNGELATRNSYGGLKGGFGQVIVGHHDTPFKKLGSTWGIFSDTVGDRRTILGASYSDGNQLNERAKNAVMYSFKSKGLLIQAMHAVDGEDTQPGEVDNNDIKMSGMAVHYKKGKIWVGLANEVWNGHSKAGDVSAIRLAMKYKLASAKVGFIFETIDSDTDTQWKRNALGVNVLMDMGKGDFRAHYLLAESAEGTSETGARNISLGYFHNLDKTKKIYLAYSATSNDSGASFQGVDGGHGDEVKTEPGGNPNSISAGLVFKF